LQRNLDTARQWMEKAAAQGDEEAFEWIKMADAESISTPSPALVPEPA
jgi:TPR repeat protein